MPEAGFMEVGARVQLVTIIKIKLINTNPYNDLSLMAFGPP
jgi:hypothetical protein